MKSKRYLIIVSVALVTLTMCTNQKKSDSDDQNVSQSVSNEMEEEGKVYDVVDVMPDFPGGLDSLATWMTINAKCPKEAERLGVEGDVVCTFIVEKDGSITNPRVEYSVDSILDKEALRVIAKMPRWRPGMLANGDTVRVRWAMPITFALNKAEQEVKGFVSKRMTVPQFPGGQDSLMNFFSKNIVYPELAEQNGVQGRVMVSFVIDETGQVTQPVIEKSVDPLLDKEALRLVNMLPKWKPGELNGKPAKIKHTVPVNFVLN